MTASTQVLILGIGNLLWADEGFGIRAVEALNRHYAFPDDVTLMDGGTQGLYLVQHVREARILVVFDAVDYGLPPGTLKRVEGEAVPRFLGAKKVSLHQTGFQEVLATAQMLGDYPQHLLLVGVQPEELEDYGGSLRDSVKEKIEPALQLALEFLAERGVYARRREVPLAADRGAGAIADIRRYEQDRPSAEAACRDGDGRVLRSGAYRVAPRPLTLDGAIPVGLDHHLEKYR